MEVQPVVVAFNRDKKSHESYFREWGTTHLASTSQQGETNLPIRHGSSKGKKQCTKQAKKLSVNQGLSYSANHYVEAQIGLS